VRNSEPCPEGTSHAVVVSGANPPQRDQKRLNPGFLMPEGASIRTLSGRTNAGIRSMDRLLDPSGSYSYSGLLHVAQGCDGRPSTRWEIVLSLKLLPKAGVKSRLEPSMHCWSRE
jgi:hypothetical protein